MVDQVKESQNDMSNGKVLSGSPGIVVLSPSLQILHMNRQAQLLISDLVPITSEAPPPNHRPDVLPPTLVDLSRKILSVLRTRQDMNGNGQLVIHHAATEFGNPVFIRGMGVPSGHGVEHAHIVLFLTGTSTDHSEHHQGLGGGL